jgi:hypothetical protein
MPMISLVSHKRNVLVAPSYAYIIENIHDNGFTYRPGDRYSIVWFRGFQNLFATTDPIENNRVDFGNIDMWGGCVRKFINTGETDDGHEAFAYLYYPSTKDLYCIALNADEARFGGIVVQPAIYNPIVQKFERFQYLMNKWRRLTPLIGKWALFFNQIYTEVTYRPGNQGALAAASNFKPYAAY